MANVFYVKQVERSIFELKLNFADRPQAINYGF